MLNLENLDEFPMHNQSPHRQGQVRFGINSSRKPMKDRVKSRICCAGNHFGTDHYPFATRKIPAMVIGLAHEEDTHLPTDSADKIDFEKLTERANYILELLLGLTNTKEKMDFMGDLSKDVGFVAVLASAEEIKTLKLDSQQGGLKVSSIIPSSVAFKRDWCWRYYFSVDGKIISSTNKREDIIREGFAEKNFYLKFFEQANLLI